MKNNILLNTDSYKASHWLQYPAGTENVFSYIESRGGKFDKTVFFGLQMFLKEYLTTPITQEMIDEADKFIGAHIGPGIFNREGWEYILKRYGGYLPVRIKAVPEGMIIPVHNVLVTIEATDPKCFWLTSFLETALVRSVWYPTTVATISWNIKQVIKRYLTETGDVNLLPFRLHDFGSRGVSSFESAGIGGAAHLVNFMGTDTITGVVFAMKYYNTEMPGFSIPAAEHSTITTFGKEGEVEAFRNMLRQFAKPGSLVAVVSDSYDIFNAVDNIWGKELKQEVIDSGATVIVRPDSGDPTSVVLKVVQSLDNSFGSTINDKGYKVLNHVRVIQGDGINENTIREILETLKANSYSASNMAFGMGGMLLQGLNRDTQKFAMKASAVKINGKWIPVSKDPVTDPGKRSKAGRLELIRLATGEIKTVAIEDSFGHELLLKPVFADGLVLKEWTFTEVRENITK